MDTIYIIAMFVSIFFNCMGIFYCPIEACTDSLLFIIIATMVMHKVKVKKLRLEDSHNTLDLMTECAILCLLTQILLLFVWFPVHKSLQVLVDYVCNQHPEVFQLKIKEYGASVGVLAIELAVLLQQFGIEDVQRLYGTKDDLVSESILSIVAEQQKTVRRREARMRRR